MPLRNNKTTTVRKAKLVKSIVAVVVRRQSADETVKFETALEILVREMVRHELRPTRGNNEQKGI